MPNLVDCSEEEWAAVLPGLKRPPTRGAASKGGPRPSKRRRSQAPEDDGWSEVDFSPLAAYQTAIRKNVKQGIIPGYCSIVLWRDRVLHVDASGAADLDVSRPMRTDSIVRLYCMGKSLTAAGLMLLVEHGKCSLEDDVAKYIPAFLGARVAPGAGSSSTSAAASMPPSSSSSPASAGRRRAKVPSSAPLVPLRGTITLRRLLTHCSGMGYGKEFNLPPEGPAEEAYAPIVRAVESKEISSLEAFCDALALQAPLRRQPGTAFEYSYGLDIIGRVIEVVSGRPLDEFLREELFAPLGMVDTGFAVPAASLPRLATLYGGRDTAASLAAASALRADSAREQGDEPAWKLVPLDGQPLEDSAWAEGQTCSVHSGGGLVGHNRGGLVSTLNDMARFCLMLLSGGLCPGTPNGGPQRRLFKEATMQEMVGQDWLRLPECLGRPQSNASGGAPGVTAKGAFGWNALGELGVEDADLTELSPDAFEPGEFGYGGIAETFWSVNPRRGLAIIWITQQVDNHSWTSPKANLWLAARKAVEKAAPSAAAPGPTSGSPAVGGAFPSGGGGEGSGAVRRRISGKRAPGPAEQ